MKVTEQVIHKLFYMLRNQFGSYWIMTLGDRPIVEIKSEWQAGLKPFTAELIGKVLADLKAQRPKRPPTLAQFQVMLKDKKSHKAGCMSDVFWEKPELNQCEKKAKSGHLKNVRDIIAGMTKQPNNP